MAFKDIRWRKHFRDLGWGLITNPFTVGIWFAVATLAAVFLSAATSLPLAYTWVGALIILFLLNPRARLLRLRAKSEGVTADNLPRVQPGIIASTDPDFGAYLKGSFRNMFRGQLSFLCHLLLGSLFGAFFAGTGLSVWLSFALGVVVVLLVNPWLRVGRLFSRVRESLRAFRKDSPPPNR
ncbi:hypothetical protein [Ensifer aridi]|uniref:hypothetical protein n=1 Tax=Ensifer aridi TaxID=1708715 RepID=UPI00047B6B1C|nr:hypothetical protein [Ensifer aridi]